MSKLALHGSLSEKNCQHASSYVDDFRDFDVNADNFIDAAEIRAQFRGDLDERELVRFFQDVDKNDDGLISEKEYGAYALML